MASDNDDMLVTVGKSDQLAIGERIRDRRAALGLSQQQLAERITATRGRLSGSVGAATVSKWENGHQSPQRLLAELCAALELSTDELLHGARRPTTAERDSVTLKELRKLYSDDDLAHLKPHQIPLLARLLEGEDVEAWRAKAALEMLFPRPKRG